MRKYEVTATLSNDTEYYYIYITKAINESHAVMLFLTTQDETINKGLLEGMTFKVEEIL